MTVKAWGNSDLSLLWEEYKKVGNVELRNRLVEEYLWLVKKVVNGMMNKAFAKFIGYDEIVSAGNFGLIQAVEGFDPDRGIKFTTYAPTRIKGAILDWLREIDWIPRLVRSNARLYEKATSELRDESGREPDLQDVADYLHISFEEASGLQQDAKGVDTRFQQEGIQARGEEDTFGGMPALDQMQGKSQHTPFDKLTETDGFDELVACLTDREQIIITLYYRNEFTMQKISLVLGLSESRISQAHDKALIKIRDLFFL